jgi:hypothetical protein
VIGIAACRSAARLTRKCHAKPSACHRAHAVSKLRAAPRAELEDTPQRLVHRSSDPVVPEPSAIFARSRLRIAFRIRSFRAAFEQNGSSSEGIAQRNAHSLCGLEARLELEIRADREVTLARTIGRATARRSLGRVVQQEALILGFQRSGDLPRNRHPFGAFREVREFRGPILAEDLLQRIVTEPREAFLKAFDRRLQRVGRQFDLPATCVFSPEDVKAGGFCPAASRVVDGSLVEKSHLDEVGLVAVEAVVVQLLPQDESTQLQACCLPSRRLDPQDEQDNECGKSDDPFHPMNGGHQPRDRVSTARGYVTRRALRRFEHQAFIGNGARSAQVILATDRGLR